MSVTAAPNVDQQPYHLSEEQIRFFDDNGYVVLRNRITEPLLGRLQDAADRWIATGKAAGPGSADFQFAERANGRTMFRVDYLHDKGESASLDLLGSPEMLGIAESLAGPNFVPTYESMVFKDEGDGAAIDWHQDAVHPRRFRIFNVDLYLDASAQGQGALRVAPGSHTGKVDICQLEQEYGWDAPGVIHAEMQPGDILVHDVMVVHGSEAVTGNRLRRTIYYEFRAAEQILTEGPWDSRWVDQRLRLVPLALRQHRQTYPDVAGFVWNADERHRPVEMGDAETELRVVHTGHSPGSYCSAGDVPLPKSAD
ncbi:MAG TPA: phytanoyl-CoA dioxygenase family protein [Mycobacteriales bacterium]|nr:phytanoyl-CoA dioxygenase family protein [Mycobacteriales bacterium]